jgi:hypothetical protein
MTEQKIESASTLHAHSTAALLLAFPAARRVYNDFLWNYAGDPYSHKMPDITRPVGDQSCTYDLHVLSSYTEHGALVHVRSSSRLNNVAARQRFLVATALLDIPERGITEWYIDAAVHEGLGDGLRTEISLQDPLLPSVQAMPMTEDDSSAEAILRARKTAEAVSALPRLVLTSQGCQFVYDGQAHALAPIVCLVRDFAQVVEQFPAQFTDTAVAA